MDVMKVFETVTRNNESAGAFLMDAVVYDYLADVAKEYGPEITETYSLWALDRVQVAKRALGRKYVADMVEGQYPGEDVRKAAEWLNGLEAFVVAASKTDVSKAANEWFNIDGKQVQRQVNRDARGRFARGVNTNKSTKLRDVAGQPDRISPTLKGYFDGNYVPFNDIDSSDMKAAERHQGQWDQVSQIVGGFARDFKGSEKAVDVVMEVRDSETGDLRVVGFPLSRFKQQDGESGPNTLPDLKSLRPLTNEEILNVSLEPNKNASDKDVARLATYNSLGRVGGQALASLANTSDERLVRLRDALRMPGTGESAPTPGLNRLFGLLGAGGAVLEENIGSNKLTQAARFVGAVGPQAEEVLSPYVRRAAYRYRGTEVKPASALNPATADPGIEAAWSEKGLRGDALKQQVIADNASLYLATTLPKDPILARLSEKSGQVLPSRGVIYNAEGKPVTEAVGFTDDHYLPFDLKNLGALRGGQYVRTRVTGGLTGEDVYAAVMTGARQVQVVSESGVFTLEFQPDFRGARANSDKARGMYDRYLKILDAVDQSGLYLQDLPPDRMREINRQAKEQAQYGGDVDEIRDQLVQQARDEMDDLDEGEIQAVAAQAFKIATGRDIAPEEAETAGRSLTGRLRRAYTEAYEEGEQVARASKVNRLRLNGEGYAVALKTLEAQFPQFIRRTDRRELGALGKEAGREMPKTRRFAEDRGYVSPGGLRADRVRSGFYQTGNINPPSKPNAPVSQRSSASAPKVEEPQAEVKAAPAAEVADTTPKKGVENRLAQRQERMKADFDKQVKTLASDLSLMTDSVDPDVQAKYLGTDFEGMDSPAKKVLWLMTNMGSKTSKVLTDPATQGDAIAALSDKAAMQSAVDQLFKDSDVASYGSVSIGGQELAVDEAAEVLSARAGDLAEMAFLSRPFSKAKPSGPEQAFHTGVSPQRMPEIADIGDAAQLEAYSSKNPAIATEAKALRRGGPAQIGAQASARAEAFREVDAGRRRAAANGFKGTNPSDYVDQDAFQGAYPGVEFSMSNLRAADPIKDGTDFQKAWSLAVTAELLSRLGDDLPKAGAADGPLKKSAPKVRILPPSDPLAMAVADRVAKGLPFVPTPLSTGTR